MSVELPVPDFPESVDEGTLLAWTKADGDTVSRDEKLADVETDKVVLEVFALESGTLSILKQEGDILKRGDIIGTISGSGAAPEPKAEKTAQKKVEEAPVAEKAPAPAAPKPAVAVATSSASLSPAVRKLLIEHGIHPESISGTGKGGRITKADVQNYVEITPSVKHRVGSVPEPEVHEPDEPRELKEGENRVPMSQLRKRVAQRLKEVQNTAAILTTFNEVNMKPVMDLRAKYKEKFEKQYGTKLGLMSFFVKAATEALKSYPDINAFVEGTDIIYHDYLNVGIAVDSPRGLVVPVLKNADSMSFAEIESGIRDFAVRAKDAKLQYEELVGGTFTITNGGVFGSMLSTPILNSPQSAILGMHNIVERPWVVDGEIVVRPIMYLALTYDHRIVDGRSAVQFLVSLKESLEDPHKLLIQL